MANDERKGFLVRYRKKGFPWSEWMGDEVIQAESIDVAGKLASERALSLSWYVELVSQTRYELYKKNLERLSKLEQRIEKLKAHRE